MRTVAAKELTELFRDWRTILISVGVPLLLFPLLVSLAFAGSAGGSRGQARIALVEQGRDSLAVVPFLQSLDRYNLVPLVDMPAARAGVADGDFAAALRFLDGGARAELIYNNAEPRSAEVAGAIHSALEQYSTGLATRRLEEHGLARDLLTPLVVELNPLHDGARAAGTLALSLLVPVLTLLAAAISPIAAAGDLGAGEKERGTLEPLFGTCANRAAVVAGKFCAVLVMALIGVASFFTGAALAYLAGPILYGAARLEFSLPLPSLALTVLLASLTAAVFSAVELAISLCARSAKAAQALFLPVLFLASAAGYGAVSLTDAPRWYAHVPLLNLGLAIRASVAGGAFRPVTVSLWAVIYIAAALRVASAVVRSERVLRQR
ncbi:MAG: ABC transporter permease [Spirochaetaceae bacterium]|nr:MAG: ABC transporter permease [Spirochaetaceae bacterium]